MSLPTTALHELHEELGGRLVDSTGWELPVQFTGIIVEHRHIRKSAPLFDVSHMGQVLTYPESGNLADAAAAPETLVPASVAGLEEGRQRYGLFADENGGVLDDLMFVSHGDHCFLVANATRSDHSLRLLRTLERVMVEHIADRSLLALQGPRAEEALVGLIPDAAGLRFMDSRVLDWDGVTVWVPRSGYTGKDGFETPVPSAEVEYLTRTLLGIGWVLPAGLGAYDSLRLEAGMPLYGHEFGPQIAPVETDLGWTTPKVRCLGGSREGGFPGAGVILKQLVEGTPRKRVGLRVEGRAPVCGGARLFLSEIITEPVAKVTSGGFGPIVGDPIAMAMLPMDIQPGVTVHAKMCDRRLPLTVTALPLITPPYKC